MIKNLLNFSPIIRVVVIIVVMAFIASQMMDVYAAKAFVGKTGQTTKYLDGDDGDLEAGVYRKNQRFEDNGNGTITDKLTNLIWDKDANRFGTIKKWADALTDCNQLADNSGDLTDGSQAGDWRLSNRFELESLLHLGVSSPVMPDTLGTGQWSQGDPFNNVQSDWYWTSTTYAGLTGTAFNVDIDAGRVSTNFKGAFERVWCVRDNDD